MLMEIRLNGLRMRRLLDYIGFFTMFGMTIIGDAAIGGDIFYGSAIPVVGPFINIGLVPNHSPTASRDRVLFAIAGTVQTFLFVDLIRTGVRIKNLHREVRLGANPVSGSVMLAVSF